MMICSLPKPTWGQMKLVLAYSENIKTFANISHHLELEAECMGAHQNTLLVAQSGQHKAFRPECLLLPRLGDKEGVLVRPYELCLKLKMTKNISKSLDILTMCQNKLHLPPSRFRQ